MIGAWVKVRSSVMTSGAVEVGQAEVEDDDVGRAVGRRAQRGPAVGGGEDGVAAGGEVDPQRAEELGVVVDDQDAGHGASSAG